MLSHDPLMHDHTGTAIARFDRYHGAQLAVDRLADAGVDVTGTEIVASGLHIVEHVTGKRGWWNSLGLGALNGALVGGFLTTVIAAFSIIDSIGAFWAFVVWGAGLGALVGAWLSGIGYWSHRGTRDFFSVRTLGADHYDVIVPAVHAERARELLT